MITLFGVIVHKWLIGVGLEDDKRKLIIYDIKNSYLKR